MNRFICSMFLKAIKTKEMLLLTLFIILLIIIAALINLANVTDTITISILASMIASIFILIIYKLLDSKDETILSVYKKYGLKNLYSKKTDATEDFTDKIMKAKSRVWAIGMTNKSFIKQQQNNLNEILKKRENLNVKIVYWNDCTVISKKDNTPRSIIDVQLALENQDSITCAADITEHNSIKAVNTSIKSLQRSIAQDNQDNVEIGFLSVPSSFSCLIVDNDVFFFPFLSNSESNISPMVLCDAKSILGKSIVDNFTYIFQQPEYYIAKKLNDGAFTANGESYEDCLNGE